MNTGGNCSTSFEGTPIHEGQTRYLREAQEEALSVAPKSPTLKWRRTTSDRIVAPLLSQSIEPLDKLDRKRAYNSAIYYSECFLKGVTPNDADTAAVSVQQQYKRWWVNGTRNGELSTVTKTVKDEDEFSEIKNLAVVSDDSHQGCSRSPKRRRRSLRSLIEDVTLSRKMEFPVGGTMDCKSVKMNDGGTNVILPNRSFSIRSIPNLSSVTNEQIEYIRDKVIAELRVNGGNLDNDKFRSGLDILQSYYLTSHCDVRKPDSPYEIDGTWLTLSKLTFTECKGRNAAGDQVYTLGRMSFDMFRPTGIRCSIQGNFNTVHELHGELPQSIPRSLRKSINSSLDNGEVKGLRTYNIVVAFTIEPNQNRSGEFVDVNTASTDFVLRKPIRGIMTTFGFAVPDPNCSNRLSIWFTGGQLEVNDEENDMEAWRQIFDHGGAPKRDMKEFARVLAAKVLLGADIPDSMDVRGNMTYSLTRPIGGHGSAYCDVLYIDNKLRIMKGHHGAIFAFSKVATP